MTEPPVRTVLRCEPSLTRSPPPLASAQHCVQMLRTHSLLRAMAPENSQSEPWPTPAGPSSPSQRPSEHSAIQAKARAPASAPRRVVMAKNSATVCSMISCADFTS